MTTWNLCFSFCFQGLLCPLRLRTTFLRQPGQIFVEGGVTKSGCMTKPREPDQPPLQASIPFNPLELNPNWSEATPPAL